MRTESSWSVVAPLAEHHGAKAKGADLDTGTTESVKFHRATLSWLRRRRRRVRSVLVTRDPTGTRGHKVLALISRTEQTRPDQGQMPLTIKQVVDGAREREVNGSGQLPRVLAGTELMTLARVALLNGADYWGRDRRAGN